MTNVGIIGSGDVGKALSKGFLKYGYQVTIGSDHPEKISNFKKENPGIETATFDQAAKFGDIVVVCVKGTVAEKIVEKVRQNLSEKTVIDATNPISDVPPQNGVLKFFTNF